MGAAGLLAHKIRSPLPMGDAAQKTDARVFLTSADKSEPSYLDPTIDASFHTNTGSPARRAYLGEPLSGQSWLPTTATGPTVSSSRFRAR
jgi:hypothetical protein